MGSKQTWGSEIFLKFSKKLAKINVGVRIFQRNIFWLLFDVREQLLKREKLLFYFSKTHTLQKCHITIYFQIRDKFLDHSGPVFVFFPYQQPKSKFLKNENHFTYVCQLSWPQDVQFLQYCVWHTVGRKKCHIDGVVRLRLVLHLKIRRLK